MRLLGLRLQRYGEWIRLVRDEGRRIGVRALARQMLLAARGGLVERSIWRERMRACAGCPIYDRRRHACRNGELGCGCWMPLKAMFQGPQCWGRARVPDGLFGHRV